jgi:hypothetical protein
MIDKIRILIDEMVVGCWLLVVGYWLLSEAKFSFA